MKPDKDQFKQAAERAAAAGTSTPDQMRPLTRYVLGDEAEAFLASLPQAAASPTTPRPVAALPAPVPAKRTAPCVHRGERLPETRQCPTCRGVVHLTVFACALYGKCIVADKQTDLQSCATCPDYAPEARQSPA